jgi:Glycosyl hydrolase family 76
MQQRRLSTPVISGPRVRPRSVGFVFVLCAMAAMGSLAVGIGNAAASVSAQARTTDLSNALSIDQQDAVASYQALQQNLYEPPAQLYQGLPSNSCEPYSCLWPFTNAMAATVYLAASPGGRAYTPDVLARLLGLVSYADLHETSPSGTGQPPAFQSAVAPPKGPGGNTFYDDNAWSALDLIASYRLTGSRIDLIVAQDLFNFVLTGWDASQTNGCPGGVFWEDVSGSQRNTTANAANAEVGLQLYQLTKDPTDLWWAAGMYQWVNKCLKSPSGLYDDHVNPDGSVNTTIWSYNQGTMVGAGVLLFQITGNSGYLTAAQDTAAAAVAHFGTAATLQSQGPAFNAIYFRDLFLLNQVQANSAYGSEAQAYATYMWTQRNSSGLFLQNGNTNGVNGTAPMVEIYSLLAGSPALP